VKDGVEIVERETVRRLRLERSSLETDQNSTRLVIGDALAGAKLLVAKTRSEIRGLNSLLRTLNSTPLRVK
jgi:hypothetical protein